MSGIVNKIKDALNNDHNTSTTSTGTAEGVAGPHSTRVANAADPRVDSDLDGSRNLGASAGTTGTANYGATTGTTGYNNTTGTGVTGGVSHSSGAGPHNSSVANKLDPRVDSTTGATTGTTGYGSTTGTTDYGSTTGTTGHHTTGTGLAGTTHNTTAGPHSSNLANKLDPRVDSTTGATSGTTGYGSTTGTAGNYGTHTGTGTAGGISHSTNAGPHDSNVANKLDPRVDSTTGATSGTTGYGSTTGTAGNYGTHTGTGTGTVGGISHSTNAGPHDSNVANKLDPRVDSDLDGRGNRHVATGHSVLGGASGSHATPGSGTAQNTAGPHNSDLMNKLDPRVDSDLDGSKTVGGNRTNAKDTRDAAQVPPSVLRESLGEPHVTHGNHEHNHAGRHGSVSHQVADRGI